MNLFFFLGQGQFQGALFPKPHLLEGAKSLDFFVFPPSVEYDLGNQEPPFPLSVPKLFVVIPNPPATP